ncbi:hypothetical protein QMK19_22780 [Streptomyces sp. H10-C2]|uniref:hypothetical protein n=1 Tax=unclassified Streptomyces TaxID=2593676 RepID=UPI0024B9B8DF|nr:MULTISPECIES: hypothetical protein [unclassified Streptomyces]MDJ0343661.1 hypothetical protein [Streptomyces sp. PH10-H1]MDJ0372412.1 hypothetical protein [Streptomyces sp. H10-C2]
MTIAIVVVVIILAAALATVMLRPGGMGGQSLRRRFGPEYERVLGLHDGDTEATDKELTERLQRHGDLKTLPLSAESREEYTARWSSVQEHFIDSPAKALTEADTLIEQLARERGYPDAKSAEHFDALSVHHARDLQGYRDAHTMAGRTGQAGGEGGASTEEMRAALVRARSMFAELIRADGHGADRNRRTDAEHPDERTAGKRSGNGLHLGTIGRRQN